MRWIHCDPQNLQPDVQTGLSSVHLYVLFSLYNISNMPPNPSICLPILVRLSYGSWSLLISDQQLLWSVRVSCHREDLLPWQRGDAKSSGVAHHRSHVWSHEPTHMNTHTHIHIHTHAHTDFPSPPPASLPPPEKWWWWWCCFAFPPHSDSRCTSSMESGLNPHHCWHALRFSTVGRRCNSSSHDCHDNNVMQAGSRRVERVGFVCAWPQGGCV